MKKSKRIFAVVMALMMVFCYMPGMAFADDVVTVPTTTAAPATSQFADMPNNWSTAALNAAVNNGLIKGYEGLDGLLIKASGTLTRAEMATVVNRAFGATETASLSGVADVPSNAWYAAELAKAVKMGTMKLDTQMRPNANITRQETFTILARAFKQAGGTSADLAKFSDGSAVASYAVDGMGALIKKGYVSGNNNNLNPTSNITRAEFAKIMDNMVKQYYKTGSTVVASGNVMINAAETKLVGATVNGDLIIGDGVGNGNVTLDSVNVTGDTIVRGGGVNSIIIKGNSNLGNVIVSKVDGNVRVSVEGNAKVEVIFINDGKDDVLVEGKIGTLKVESADVPVVVQNAKIAKVEITAAGADVKIAKDSTVSELNVEAKADLKIDGTVTKIQVANTAKGTNVDISKNAKVTELKADTKVTTSGEGKSDKVSGTGSVTEKGKEPAPAPAPSSGGGGGSSSGGGGGGSPSTTVAVSAITVTGAGNATTMAIGSTLQMSAAIAPTNATDKRVTWAVTNGTGEATIDANGLLTATKVGTVAVVAVNEASEVMGSKLITVTAAQLSVAVSKLATAPDDVNKTDSQANQNAVTVSKSGNAVTVSGNLAAMKSFASTNLDQGSAKWVGLVVATGQNSIIGVKYGAYDFTQDDVNEANSVGAPAGSFVLWIKADEVVTTAKTFTLATVGKADTTITINFTDPNASIATAKGLVPTTKSVVEATDTNLLTMLNAIDGMAATGVTLTLDATGNANVADDGGITYTGAEVVGNVIVKINKADGTEQTVTVAVTVPAHTATAAELANASIATAKGLVPTTKSVVEATDTNLLTMLNAIDGMAATGVTLTLESSNANVANGGVITYTGSEVVGNVIVKINKADGTEQTVTVAVTVPAHTATAAELDQADVDVAIAKVTTPIASITVAGGAGADANAKNAAVKAYVEGLDGMSALGVTVNVEAETDFESYKVTITKGAATTPGVKDNVAVTEFIAPLAAGIDASVEAKSTSEAGKVMLTVSTAVADASHAIYYRVVDTEPTAMHVGDVLTVSDEWHAVPSTASFEITAQDGKYIEIAEFTTAESKVTKWGKIGPTDDGYIAPANAANAASVATVKGLIEGATYSMTQAHATDEPAVKAAVEEVIEGLALDGVSTNVVVGTYTPAVAGIEGTPDGTNGTYTFTVELTKGADETLATATTEVRTMTITATEYDSTAQDNLDIAGVKTIIEGATYTAAQADAADASTALTKAQALVNALELKGTTATVVAGTFTAATAGTVGTPAGTNGSYPFTVTIAKGLGTTVTSAQKTMTITATAYDTTPAGDTSGITNQALGALGSKQVTLTITVKNAAGDNLTSLLATDFSVQVKSSGEVTSTGSFNESPFSGFVNNEDGTYTIVYTGAGNYSYYEFTNLAAKGVLIEAGPTGVSTPAGESPTLSGATTSTDGTTITMTFNKAMVSINTMSDYLPLFSASVDGVSRTFSNVALNEDNTKIDLTLSGLPVITSGVTVTLSYSGAMLESTDLGFLQNFSDYSVTNNSVAAKTVSVGDLVGGIIQATVAAAGRTYAVTTENIANGQVATITWYADASKTANGNTAPGGIAIAPATTVETNAVTLNVTVTETAPTVAGDYFFTITVDGVESAVKTLTVAAAPDTTAPVITAADATVAIADLAAWTETVSATDDIDGDITVNVVATYFESDGSTSIANLAAAKTYIGDAKVNTTFVIKYNVSDAASNPATEKVVTITVTP